MCATISPAPLHLHVYLWRNSYFCYFLVLSVFFSCLARLSIPNQHTCFFIFWLPCFPLLLLASSSSFPALDSVSSCQVYVSQVWLFLPNFSSVYFCSVCPLQHPLGFGKINVFYLHYPPSPGLHLGSPFSSSPNDTNYKCSEKLGFRTYRYSEYVKIFVFSKWSGCTWCINVGSNVLKSLRSFWGRLMVQCWHWS